MAQISKKLRSVAGDGLMFWCPGCDVAHLVYHGAGPGPRWGWNGDAERPTFTPSVRVTYSGLDAGRDGAPPTVCHSFITDGLIRFLDDCTHALVGQTVDLLDWPARGAP